MAVEASRDRLLIGPVEVVLSGAGVWEPRPDWARLRAQRPEIERQLPRLLSLAAPRSPAGSLLSLLTPDPPAAHTRAPLGGRDARVPPLLARFRRALPDLRAGWGGDREALARGVREVAGLGRGLTPAGDDFLLGSLARAWLTHPDPASFGRVVMENAAGRTTTLAVSLLQAAAGGEFNAPWHRLLDALALGDDKPLAQAVQSILAYGATSGADGLAGFLLAKGSAPVQTK